MCAFDLNSVGGDNNKSVNFQSAKQEPKEVKGATKKDSLWVKENKSASGRIDSVLYYKDKNNDGKITSDELVAKDEHIYYYREGSVGPDGKFGPDPNGRRSSSKDIVQTTNFKYLESIDIVHTEFDENGKPKSTTTQTLKHF